MYSEVYRPMFYIKTIRIVWPRAPGSGEDQQSYWMNDKQGLKTSNFEWDPKGPPSALSTICISQPLKCDVTDSVSDSVINRRQSLSCYSQLEMLCLNILSFRFPCLFLNVVLKAVCFYFQQKKTGLNCERFIKTFSFRAALSVLDHWNCRRFAKSHLENIYYISFTHTHI